MRTLTAVCLAVASAVSVYAETPSKNTSYLSALDESAPQVIFGGEWTTKITLTNLRASAVEFPIAFYGPDGRAQQVPILGRTTASSYRVSIPARGQVTLETPYDTSAPGRTGWAQVDVPCTTSGPDTCGRVAGTVTLRNRNATRPDFEAVFQFRHFSDQIILPIDNTAGHSTVLMIVNESSFREDTITVSFRDQNGSRVHLDQFTLGPRATLLVNVAEKWPQTANFKGVADFTSGETSMILTGLRINPTNSFTPIEGFEPL